MAIVKNIEVSYVTDDELVYLYQQHQQQPVLAKLFLRYHDLVYGVCVKYLEDQEEAKDSVMNIYYELIEKLKNHQVDNFKGWLYTVTKNHCLMQLRKNKKLPVAEFKEELMQLEDFSHLDGVLEKERQLELLSACMETLVEEQRKSVKLFYLDNKCYNEIVDLTGYEWNKVRSLIQNGRRNLKICMEENG